MRTGSVFLTCCPASICEYCKKSETEFRELNSRGSFVRHSHKRLKVEIGGERLFALEWVEIIRGLQKASLRMRETYFHKEQRKGVLEDRLVPQDVSEEGLLNHFSTETMAFPIIKSPRDSFEGLV